VNEVTAVRDASALLGLLFAEEGADTVEGLVRKTGTAISAVNLCEVLDKLVERRCPADL